MPAYNERRLKESYLKRFDVARREGKAKPACAHQTLECNGCPLQDIEYALQSKTKREFLEEYLAEFEAKVAFHPATHRFYYRNKIELSYIHGKLGYIRKDDHYQSFDLKECWIIPKETNEITQKVKELLLKHPITPFELFSHTGDLRYVSFRHCRQTGEHLVSFTTFTKENEKTLDVLAKELLKLKNVTSVHWLVNDTWSNTATGKMTKHWGKEVVTDFFQSFSFELGPLTFFQTNPIMAGEMVQELLRHIPKDKVVLDAYCGVGTLSLPLSRHSKKVYGIELVDESVESARRNAEKNKVHNAVFATGKVEESMHEIPDDIEVVVLDPPRSGLHDRVIRALCKKKPEMIAYVSCNPFTLKRDLEGLSEAFKVKLVYGFDFFPHTPHMETLVILERA